MFNQVKFHRDAMDWGSGGDYRPMTDKDLINDFVLPLMNFSDKLVLAGSLSLKLLGLMKKERQSKDIDFVLTEELTQYELDHIRDFFGFTISDYTFEEYGEKVPINTPQTKRELIHLQGPKINVDIFNKTYEKPEHVITVLHNKHLIKTNHPQFTILAKCKYMLDHKLRSNQKHYNDLKQVLWEQGTNYYSLMKYLKKTNNQYISLL